MKLIRKFRKKPIVIEAIQWTGKNYVEISKFIGYRPKYKDLVGNEINQLEIVTLEGMHIATVNDWIIKGVQGEFYPCKPDIFEKTYEEVF